MKKICLLFMCLLVLPFMPQLKANTNYQAFEKLEMARGKIISQWTDKEYNAHFKNVEKRKFTGWSVHKVNSNVKVVYDTETLFSYYNNGYTPIEYEYSHEVKSSHKFNISATGSIGIKNTNTEKTFKNGLDASLKLETSYTYSKEEKETYKIKLLVDPGTQVNLYIHGEGRITNGVAARYVFFIRATSGAFEVFTITTQYHRLEKIKI